MYFATTTSAVIWIWVFRYFWALTTFSNTFHRFILLLRREHNVTKSLTGHRMHKEGPGIYQIDRQISSFQNMWYMLKAKNKRLAILCKKHLKIAFFGGHESWLPDFESEALDGRRLTPGQLHSYPWKRFQVIGRKLAEWLWSVTPLDLFLSQVTQIRVHQKRRFWGVFVHKIEFPGQTVIFYLQHVTHILKAVGLTVDLVYLGTRKVHSLTRQIFCNILGINWQCQMKPSLMQTVFSNSFLLLCYLLHWCFPPRAR